MTTVSGREVLSAPWKSALMPWSTAAARLRSPDSVSTTFGCRAATFRTVAAIAVACAWSWVAGPRNAKDTSKSRERTAVRTSVTGIVPNVATRSSSASSRSLPCNKTLSRIGSTPFCVARIRSARPASPGSWVRAFGPFASVPVRIAITTSASQPPIAGARCLTAQAAMRPVNGRFSDSMN
ncbi:hypothetical protein [Fodinicola feengrottensis]|uniref:hypothetical protein n=1 Tax=Fodinicola feengrottensis TaxID=435914 RepID=UPI002441212C|nr:hypothetical protein [Fodinicola feengrottensis]